MSIGDNILIIRKKKDITAPKLAALVGVSKQAIYQYEGNESIPSQPVLAKIAKALDVTEAELRGLTEMKVQKGGANSHEIPFYDAVAVGGMSMLADQSPLSHPTEMINPGTFLKAATGALRVYGHSMYPKYPSGCIVAFKESANAIPSVIIWGEDYVIELEERRVIKNVARGKSSEFINIISLNDGNGEKLNQDIPIKDIKRMYMVLGKIELEASL